jgi:arylsulfatase A-like enzyme
MKTMRRLHNGTILLLVFLSLSAPSSAEPPYNVVFISLTNTRADHLSAYGYERKTSPNIDAMAKESLVFENAYSHASWTLPVVVSLMTSRYPFTHGLMNRKEYEPLPAETPTLIDVLNANGYATAGFVGDRDYAGKFGHTNRLKHLRDHVNDNELEDWKKYGVLENSIPQALEWLKEHRKERFFLLIQGYDTHCPFASPKANRMFDPDYKSEVDFTRCYWTFRRTRPLEITTESGKKEKVFLMKTKADLGDDYETMFSQRDIDHMVALYDGEIFNADRQIGQVLATLKELGLDENTITVFFADHGDMFGKHGRFMRGGPLRGTFYDDVLRVPLIIRHPDIEPKSIDGLAQVIDLAPTLLDLLGLETPGSFKGKTLRPLIENGEAVNDRVFAGSSFTPKKKNAFFRHDSIITSVRSREWKLIYEKLFYTDSVQDYYELFHVADDPAERNDVSNDHPEVVARLRDEIMGWIDTIDAKNIKSQLIKQTN